MRVVGNQVDICRASQENSILRFFEETFTSGKHGTGRGERNLHYCAHQGTNTASRPSTGMDSLAAPTKSVRRHFDVHPKLTLGTHAQHWLPVGYSQRSIHDGVLEEAR